MMGLITMLINRGKRKSLGLYVEKAKNKAKRQRSGKSQHCFFLSNNSWFVQKLTDR